MWPLEYRGLNWVLCHFHEHIYSFLLVFICSLSLKRPHCRLVGNNNTENTTAVVAHFIKLVSGDASDSKDMTLSVLLSRWDKGVDTMCLLKMTLQLVIFLHVTQANMKAPRCLIPSHYRYVFHKFLCVKTTTQIYCFSPLRKYCVS